MLFCKAGFFAPGQENNFGNGLINQLALVEFKRHPLAVINIKYFYSVIINIFDKEIFQVEFGVCC